MNHTIKHRYHRARAWAPESITLIYSYGFVREAETTLFASREAKSRSRTFCNPIIVNR